MSFEKLSSVIKKDPAKNLVGGVSNVQQVDIVKKAKEKAAFIEHEAYEKGYAQGEKDGFEFGKQKFIVALQNLTRITQEIDLLRPSLYQQCEVEMVTLIRAVARKVLHHEVNSSPELIRHVLRAALAHVVETSRVKIRVHPHDFQFVDEAKNDFLAEIANLKHTEIVEDRSISQGGCILETEFGDVDATLEQQLSAIENAMDAVLKGTRSP